MKAVYVLLFFALVGCKVLFGWNESASKLLSEKAVSALLFTLFLGLPQMVCLLVVAIKEMTGRRAAVAASALMVFVVTAWYFGTLPGSRAPAWGGDANFEVPVMFIVELFVATSFAVKYSRLSPR